MNNYRNNEQIGEVEVYLGDKIIYTEPVYIKIKEKKNLFDRIKDWFF